MPPWKPERAHGEFLGRAIAHRRSDSQRFSSGSRAGAPEGRRRRSAAGAARGPTGWQLGDAGSRRHACRSRTCCALTAPDVFRTFVLADSDDAPRYVRAHGVPSRQRARRASRQPRRRSHALVAAARCRRSRAGIRRQHGAGRAATRRATCSGGRRDSAASFARRHGVATRAGERSRRRSCTCSRPASPKPLR